MNSTLTPGERVVVPLPYVRFEDQMSFFTNHNIGALLWAVDDGRRQESAHLKMWKQWSFRLVELLAERHVLANKKVLSVSEEESASWLHVTRDLERVFEEVSKHEKETGLNLNWSRMNPEELQADAHFASNMPAPQERRALAFQLMGCYHCE